MPWQHNIMSKNLRKRPPPSQSASTPAASAAAEPSTEFNPVSKWQECVEIPGLTQFDIHRRPLRENGDDDAIRVRTMQLDDLGHEFRCPVCLGYIKNARQTPCLHRFCDECIEKCLRLSKNKECPECRAHIPCRRSLRPDKKFDELMKSIYGDVEKIEKYEEEEIARLNKKKMNNVRGFVRVEVLCYG